ncbi:MAG: hypothetical protein ACRC4T_15345 [Cetobacterium sp.]
MKPNFIYRTINPVYMIKPDGDVFDVRNGNKIEINKKNLDIVLETLAGDYTRVKVYSIYAVTFLGSRSLMNKHKSKMVYKNKFK